MVADLIHRGTSRSLSKTDRLILAYVVKLTRTPHLVSTEDITLLREGGLDDRAIHDVCAITAYFAFVNRIADGLGVELEQRFSEESSQ
ncbi:MAG: carboxymuconolactone decarboxylase family protein [Fidelibacterota bacterium]